MLAEWFSMMILGGSLFTLNVAGLEGSIGSDSEFDEDQSPY